jgi:LysM repeat protein
MNDTEIANEVARQRAMVEEHHRLIAALRRRLLLERLFFIGVTALLLVVIWRIAGPARPAIIKVGGKDAAIVASKRVAEEVIAAVKRDQAGPVAKLADFREKVTVATVSSRGAGRVMRDDEAQAVLAKRVHAVVRGYGVYVNNRLAVALPTRQQADRTVQGAQIKYAIRGNRHLETTFRESVKVKPVTVEPDQVVLKTDAAVDALTKPSGRPRTYVVKSGDTAWQIARREGLDLVDLQRENPGRNLDRIRIGDEISLGPAKPTLTVIAVDIKRSEKRIPHRVVVIPTTDIAGGQRKVIQEGKDGLEVTEVRVTYHNGRLVKEERLGTRFEQAPIPQKVLVGR